jgi:predicted XRE-type DNA-binding protein
MLYPLSYIGFYLINQYFMQKELANIFGGERTRTDNFMRAKHVLYQLNYTPFTAFICATN